MREIERSGENVEEAVEAALSELGASEQEVEIEILQEPRGGFLGLGSQGARVRVRLKGQAPELEPEELNEQGELASEFLEELLDRMGIPTEVEPTFDDGVMYVDILADEASDEDVSQLIGHHGQTLDAFQELSRVVVGRRTGTRARFVVDVEDYRRRRRARLAGRARDIARKVQRSRRAESLEPMNPYERKIVHDTVAKVPGVESLSEGEGPERHVIVRPAAG